MGNGRFFLPFRKPKYPREDRAEENEQPAVPEPIPTELPLVAKPKPAILSKPSQDVDAGWSGTRDRTAHHAGREQGMRTRNLTKQASPNRPTFSWTHHSAGTALDIVGLERAHRPALKRTTAVKRLERGGRGQGVVPAMEGAPTDGFDFDSSTSDLSLQGRPRLLQSMFPGPSLQEGPGLLQATFPASKIALCGSTRSGKFLGGSPSLDKEPVSGIHSPVDLEYSKNLQVDTPKGETGFKVPNFTSTSPAAKPSLSTSGLFIDNLTRQVENPAKSPAHEKPDVYPLFGSVAPRAKAKRLRQQKQTLAPVPEDQRASSRQDSQITLCGELDPNGVYKIEESPFQKDYVWIQDVGEGGFGKAELYAHRITGQKLVCKKTRDPVDYIDGVPTEVHIARDILGNRHPRLAQILHFNHSLAETHAWMPYYNGGDLYDLVRFYHTLQRRYVPEAFIWHIFVQLASAAAYMHTGVDRSSPEQPPPRLWQPIVHRDIKPDNVFLHHTRGQTGYTDAILADFGLATTRLVSSKHAFIGTPMYQPPQLPTHTVASDIWAVGATIHFLCTGLPPLVVQDKKLDPRPSTFYDTDPSVRKVHDITENGFSNWLKVAMEEWLTWDENKRPVGLNACLKVEGYRMLWLGEGGVEERMRDWERWVEKGQVKWGCQRTKEARGFHEEEEEKKKKERAEDEEKKKQGRF
ncbi:MAG: hypothetical protein LQ350_007402 [Teloschistes chrysophthalmus]|nr:MAG: hypothetical protein LQ350_007402 [Niorma chrysophthalma]